jgi:hypothetical protein
MTQTMYDSTEISAIPAGAKLVAAYVDGFGGYEAAVARFGAANVVSISVQNTNADVADVENGAMTPADLPGWLARQYARGIMRPGIYCNQSTWPSVKAVVGGNTRVSYWIAAPGENGSAGPESIDGADAVQNVWEGTYDVSVCQPTWPWYKTPPAPPKPVYPAKQTGTVHSDTTGGNAKVYTVDGGQTWTFHKPIGF